MKNLSIISKNYNSLKKNQQNPDSETVNIHRGQVIIKKSIPTFKKVGCCDLQLKGKNKQRNVAMSMKLANRKVKRAYLYIQPKLQRKIQASRSQRWKITTEKLKKIKKRTG